MADAPARRRFGPDRIALIPVTFFLLGSLPIATSSVWLLWLLLIPIACGVWVVRARVVAAPVGVAVGNGFGVQRFAWSDVEGFDVPKRGPVRLLVTGGKRVRMTALPRRQLPLLIQVGEQAATGGA